MKKSHLILFIQILLFSNLLHAQPLTLGDNFPGPLICGLNRAVIQGNNRGLGPNGDFSCGVPHNTGWFSFFPDSSFIEFNFFFSDCLQDEGLQIVLFDQDQNEIGCFSSNGILNGSFSADVTPCEKHHFMIDGFNGDVCDFFMIPVRGIDILNDTISDLGGTCEILGPTSGPPCNAPSRATYKISCPPCGKSDRAACSIDSICVKYLWTLPPNMTIIGNPDGPSIDVQITGPVSGLIEVEIDDDGCCGTCSYFIEPIFVFFEKPYFSYSPPLYHCPGDSILLHSEYRNAPDTIRIETSRCRFIYYPILFFHPIVCVGVSTVEGDSCTNAPFICGENLNGWNFNLEDLTPVTNPQLDDVLPFQIENNRWLGWTPCEPEVELSFDISNCTNSEGVEVAVLQTSDCQSFQLIENTQFSTGANNWTISGLTPGEVYYFMFDGINGDICNIQINTISGISTNPGQLNEITPGFIDGPEKLCPGQNGDYTFVPPVFELIGGDNCPFPDSLGVDGSGGDICWNIPEDAEFVGDSTGSSITIVFPLDSFLTDLLDSLPDNNDTTIVLTSGLVYPEFKPDTTFDNNILCGISTNATPVAPKMVEVCIKIEQNQRTICAGDKFEWNGQQICGSGFYYYYSDCVLKTLLVYELPSGHYDWGTIELCQGACFQSPITGWTVCDEGTFYNTFGCESEEVEIIIKDVHPLIPTYSFDCEPDGETYSVTIEIAGGELPYFIDGQQVFGSYTISGILSGETFSVQISDSSPCNNDMNISDQHYCPIICPYNEGQMSDVLLENCDYEMAKTQHFGGEKYPSEGTFEYILHTVSSTRIGDIIARNKTGEFRFDSTRMEYESTYYVSYVVGLNVNEQVDLTHQCTKVSLGQPILFHKSPIISHVSSTPITCRNTISTLTCETDGTEFLWTNTLGFADDESITQTERPGMYSILVSNENGCETVRNVEVLKIAPEIEDAIFEMSDPICFGDKNGMIQLMEIVGEAETIYFNDDEVSLDSMLFENLAAGYYSIEIFDQNGCSIEKQYRLRNPQKMEVDLGNDFTIIRGMPISLEPTFSIDPMKIEWELPSGETMYNDRKYNSTPLVSANYLIEIENENGCIAKDEIYITVKDKVNNIFIPSAFSPNNDGNNDQFEFYSNNVIERVISLRIFDRWGTLMYIQKDFDLSEKEKFWDGTFKGHRVNNGVYSYVLELQLKDGTTAQEKGDITLIR